MKQIKKKIYNKLHPKPKKSKYSIIYKNIRRFSSTLRPEDLVGTAVVRNDKSYYYDGIAENTNGYIFAVIDNIIKIKWIGFDNIFWYRISNWAHYLDKDKLGRL